MIIIYILIAITAYVIYVHIQLARMAKVLSKMLGYKVYVGGWIEYEA